LGTDDFTATWIIDDDGVGSGGTCLFSFLIDRGHRNPGIIRHDNEYYAANDNDCDDSANEFRYTCRKLLSVNALFDNTSVATLESWYSIGVIFLIVVLLVVFTATFNHAVIALVVKPIGRVLSAVTIRLGHVADELTGLLVPDELQDADQDLDLSEADVLEIMVGKLIGIVSAGLKNREEEILMSTALDGNTKAWLKADYMSSKINSTLTKQESKRHSALEHLGLPTPSAPWMQSENAFTARPLAVEPSKLEGFDGGFDILELDEDQLGPVVRYTFEGGQFRLLSEFKVDGDVFNAFAYALNQGYRTEPRYHNWHHGVDVLHTVYLLLTATAAKVYMEPLELFAALVAALAHDLGHPGVNNGFLVKSQDPLALAHNDVSPLENMHAAQLYEVLRDPKTNIWSGLDPAQWTAARKQVLCAILNTDMASHFSKVKQFEAFEEIHGVQIFEFMRQPYETPVPECLTDPVQRLFLHEVFLHAADISNPVKRTALYEKWTARICDEFFAQGDLEASRGMAVSPMCGRENASVPNMQLGFVDFIVAPLYLVLFKLFPQQLQPLARNLQANYSHYAALAPGSGEGNAEKAMKFSAKFEYLFVPARQSSNLPPAPTMLLPEANEKALAFPVMHHTRAKFHRSRAGSVGRTRSFELGRDSSIERRDTSVVQNATRLEAGMKPEQPLSEGELATVAL